MWRSENGHHGFEKLKAAKAFTKEPKVGCWTLTLHKYINRRRKSQDKESAHLGLVFGYFKLSAGAHVRDKGQLREECLMFRLFLIKKTLL